MAEPTVTKVKILDQVDQENKQRYWIPNSLQLNEQFILGKWIQPPYKLTHKDQLILSPRLLEVYHDYKTYLCKKIDHLTFSISNEINYQAYHPQATHT